MEITTDIKEKLEPFSDGTAEVFHYMRFGAILRLSLYDKSGERWILSLSDCSRVKFQSIRFKSNFIVSKTENGDLVISSPSVGFEVVFKQCYLIHEDEYLADDRPDRSP
jgi:hypothetical protein